VQVLDTLQILRGESPIPVKCVIVCTFAEGVPIDKYAMGATQENTLRIFYRIIKTFECLHRAHVYHLDVKASNIYYD